MRGPEISKRYTISGHKDSLYTLAHGPEPCSFFSAGADGMVAQWQLEEPEEGRLLAKSPSSVYALKYLPEKNLLVIGQNFDGIYLIDLKTRKGAGSLKLTQAAIFTIEEYKGRLFIGGGDGTLSVVELEGLQLLYQQKIADKSIRTIQIHPQKEEFSVGCSDNTIKIFTLNFFVPKQVIEAHTNSVFTLAYSPDYRYLLSGSRDAHINIWKSAGEYQKENSIVAHMYAINHIAFSPAGGYFASCSMDKSIKLWNAETFKLLKVIDKGRHSGHGTSVNRLLWLSENILLSASDDRTISVWDIEWD